MEIRAPSATGVMQAITSLPRRSDSSLNCFTAHCLQAPTEPNAGCQQKYGKFMPSSKQAARRFCFSFIWYCRSSMYTVAISSGSRPRTALLANVKLEIGAEILQGALQG